MTDRPQLFNASMVQALFADRKGQTRRLKSKAQIGDRLWVRETFVGPACYRPYPPKDWGNKPIWYAADGEPNNSYWDNGVKKPGIHMPRWQSRLTLPVKDVRVERLQDISEEDAIAEGIEQIHYEGNDPEYIGATAWKDYTVYADGTPHAHAVAGWKSPIKSYESLWKTINGADSWDENPYITAITFDVIKENIDKL